jgi:hypothetical protein
MTLSQYRMRASDADREAAVERLRRSYVAGRLTHAELCDRSSAAYAARTWGELYDLTADLPAGGAEVTLIETSVTRFAPAARPFPAWARQRGPHPAAWCLPPLMVGLALLFLAVGSLLAATIPLLVLCLSAVRWSSPPPPARRR